MTQPDGGWSDTPAASAGLAEAIASHVGGVANVAGAEHCVTRLRLVLRDPKLADRDAVAGLPGVMSVVNRAGQFQIVIGSAAPEVFAELEALPGFAGGDSPDPPASGHRRLVDRAFDLITATFQPLLYVMVGSSMVKTALVLALQFGWLSRTSSTYQIWAAAGNAAFYFLPILVGITASKKLGANPYVGGVIAAALLSSEYSGLGAVGTHTGFLGLPVVVIDYSQSVFPAVIAAVLLSVLEKFLRRHIAKSMHLILVPGICLAVLVPATVILFGPIGTYVGNAISEAVGWVWGLSPLIAGALMGGLWQVFVIFGVHWGFVPVMINDLDVNGYSLLTGPLLAAVLAQGAATLAVMIRTRNRELRLLAGPAALSAFVAGVTEPAIYGVTLPLRRPFLYGCIGGAVGGGIAAAGGSAADSFVFPSLVTLPAWLHVGSFPLQVLGTSVAVATAFGLTMILGTNEKVVEPVADQAAPVPVRLGDPADSHGGGGSSFPADAALAGTLAPAADEGPVASPPIEVRSPLAGLLVALSEVPDPVFASGLLGSGVAIQPDRGLVRAPVSGRVTSLARAGHAVGITSPEGVDVLVHVGMDTVQLAGKHFDTLVKPGQQVAVGDPLILADLEALGAAGYNMVTPVVITNSAAFTSVEPATVEPAAGGRVEIGAPLLLVQR